MIGYRPLGSCAGMDRGFWAVVDGFVVGDDDEGLIPAPKPDGDSSSDDEEEDEGRLKRNREEDELADLQLIQDNLQQQEPKKQKRDAVDDLFADDSDEEPAKPTKKKDGLFDEDDFDDFIEDDLGIQQALKREHAWAEPSRAAEPDPAGSNQVVHFEQMSTASAAGGTTRSS